MLPESAAAIRINEALKREDSPHGFLPAGENALLAASDDYTGALGIEAIKIARARNATAVDKQDVLDADGRLRVSVERRNWALGVAGLAGGGAISALISYLLAGKHVIHADVWWTAIGVLGALALILLYISFPSLKRKS